MLSKSMLGKAKMPGPAGKDPMLETGDLDSLESAEEMPMEEGPLAGVSDDELMAEAEKRGMKISMPEEDMEMELEPAEDEEDEMLA